MHLFSIKVLQETWMKTLKQRIHLVNTYLHLGPMRNENSHLVKGDKLCREQLKILKALLFLYLLLFLFCFHSPSSLWGNKSIFTELLIWSAFDSNTFPNIQSASSTIYWNWSNNLILLIFILLPTRKIFYQQGSPYFVVSFLSMRK